MWGAISYNFRSHLVFLQGKVSSARYIAHLLTLCHCHFFDRKVMCFFSRTSHIHYGCSDATCFRGVQQLPWLARIPVLLPIEHVWDMMKWELSLSPEPATTLPNCDSWCKMLGTVYLRTNILHLYDHLHARINACVS